LSPFTKIDWIVAGLGLLIFALIGATQAFMEHSP
jgi:hypothetical protein